MTLNKNLLIEREQWSGNVTRRVQSDEHPKAGTFATGSAKEIASEMCSKAEGNSGTAIKKIAFYINRAGKTLKPSIRKNAEAAKNIIQKKGC